MKVGILGGTFDPVHNGHVALVIAAKKAMGLDVVFVVPSYKTPLKRRVLTSARHRAAMARLAFRSLAWVKLSLDEVRRRRISYTYQTLRRFRRRLGNQTEIYFLCGADLLKRFGRWKKPDEVMKLCRFAVACRPGSRIGRLPPGSVMFPMRPVPISSSDIRQKLARGEREAKLLPHSVRRYIQKHKLYV